MWTGRPSKTIGDLLAFDEEKRIVFAVQRVQRIDRGEDIVVAQDEKLIAVIAIPRGHHVRGAVTVALGGVRVRVALEPRRRRALLNRGLR